MTVASLCKIVSCILYSNDVDHWLRSQKYPAVITGYIWQLSLKRHQQIDPKRKRKSLSSISLTKRPTLIYPAISVILQYQWLFGEILFAQNTERSVYIPFSLLRILPFVRFSSFPEEAGNKREKKKKNNRCIVRSHCRVWSLLYAGSRRAGGFAPNERGHKLAVTPCRILAEDENATRPRR